MAASDPSTIAIIPARGGSKGMPRKNLLPICGQPMLAWTIQAMSGARAVQQVFVSTDDAEIAAVARQYGAEVINRPARIAGDRASSESALLHALEVIEQRQALPDVLVFAQCTSPMTRAEDVDRAIDVLHEQQADSVLTASGFHSFVWGKAEDGSARALNHPQDHRPMRQQREPQFLENGAVYVMRTAGFREAGYRFFGKVAVSTMPARRSFEIDEPEDVPILRALMQAELRQRSGDLLPDPVAALVVDFDGVMTDNRVNVSQDSVESVACHRGDGMGISMLRRTGMPIKVISTEKNPVVSARCAKLGIDCIQGQQQKLGVLRQWLEQRQIDPRNVIYVGNDVNDLECMSHVGCPVAVADAEPAARELARLVLTRPGGHGAVRELVDLILERSAREK